jgi:hypothetical protein
MNWSLRTMTSTQEESKRIFIKQMNTNAMYWHLIHQGYCVKKAELEAARIIHNQSLFNKLY